MAEKKESTKIEREYTIPLRDKCRPVPRYKKTPKAVKSVKEFLARHMQIRDRDLNKIKIDTYLNEQLWLRGIKKTLHKVKVKVVKEGDIVRVYAADLPEKLNFKKLRSEKKAHLAKEALEKKRESQKSLAEKAKDQLKATKEEKSKDKVEEKTDKKENEETIEKAEEKSGVSKEVAKEEAKLDVKESKKVQEKK